MADHGSPSGPSLPPLLHCFSNGWQHIISVMDDMDAILDTTTQQNLFTIHISYGWWWWCHIEWLELSVCEKTSLTQNNLTELVTTHISHRWYSFAISDGVGIMDVLGSVKLTQPHNRIDGYTYRSYMIRWCHIGWGRNNGCSWHDHTQNWW